MALIPAIPLSASQVLLPSNVIFALQHPLWGIGEKRSEAYTCVWWKVNMAFGMHTAADRRRGEHSWVSSRPSATCKGTTCQGSWCKGRLLRLSTLMSFFAPWIPLCGTNISLLPAVLTDPGPRWYKSVQHSNSSSEFFPYLGSSQLQLSPFLPFARQWNDTSVGAPVKGAGTVLFILQTWKLISWRTRSPMKAFHPNTGKWGCAHYAFG